LQEAEPGGSLRASLRGERASHLAQSLANGQRTPFVGADPLHAAPRV